MIWGLLWKNKGGLVLAAVAVAVGLFIAALKVQLVAAHSKIDGLKSDVAILEADKEHLTALTKQWAGAYKALSVSAKSCADSVEKYRDDAARMKDTGRVALEKAEARGKVAQDKINASKARILIGGNCEQAVKDARADLKGL